MSETTELDLPTSMHIDDHEETHHEAEPQERQRSPRDDMMAEISRRRAEAIERELRQGKIFADQARADAGMEPLEDPEAQVQAETEVEQPPAEPAPPNQAAEFAYDRA